MTRDYGRFLLLCALALTVAPNVCAQERVGVEFQANSYTTGNQGTSYGTDRPAVGVNAAGDFFVAWTSRQQDGSYPKFGVFAQRFSSAGNRLGTEFQVGLFTSYWGQSRPSVAAIGGGGFVVVWQSYDLDGNNGYGIFGRRFSSAGSPLGTDFQVNTFPSFDQRRPAVASASDGDFVVVWDSTHQDGDSNGVFAQRFSSTGDPLGAEFQVNAFFTDDQSNASVAVASGGAFVVAWRSSSQDGDGTGVFGRAFSSSGVAFGSEFQINASTAGGQGYPSAAAFADGSFVVAWPSGDGDGPGIFARRVSSVGAAVGDEFQVNVFTTSYQVFPSVVAEAGGAFVVAWSSDGEDDSSYGIFARRFAGDGSPLTGDFQVNTYTPNGQYRSAVAGGPGGLVVTWVSQGQDGSGHGVFGQRLVIPIVLDIDGNKSTSALTDGLLVLRHLFGFTGTTLVGGAVGGGCSRCDSAAIEPYLAGLGSTLDVDDDGSFNALTDGLLVLRYMFGFTGATLTTGVVNMAGCNRCTAAAIEAYLGGLT